MVVSRVKYRGVCRGGVGVGGGEGVWGRCLKKEGKAKKHYRQGMCGFSLGQSRFGVWCGTEAAVGEKRGVRRAAAGWGKGGGRGRTACGGKEGRCVVLRFCCWLR